MMNHLMIDLETLSTDDNAAIVSIGAAVFDNEKVIDTESWQLTFENMSGHIDPTTVAWWLSQSKEAQQATFGGDRCAPWVAAGQLINMCAKHSVTTVWANDPHFDVVILQNWWKRYSRGSTSLPVSSVVIVSPWPFKYNQPRSFRTIVELGEQVGFEKEHRDAARGMYVAHCAVEDAAAQARVVIAIKKYIANGGVFKDKPFIRKPVGSWPTN
jgi:hypothetical protein